MNGTLSADSVGRVIEGFRVERIEAMPGLRATAILLEHQKSGARLLHLYAPQDTENCFCITFPTPPQDDTGVPHILEHAVLGGSRKFPVREPFFEMVKMSMATFINAMTSQAWTCYPVASNVKKDFFNLVEVYLDAVFHPGLKEDVFRREGHHLALEDNADLSSPLQIKGIVYSEMKGAYSSPESIMWELAERGLYPDTALGRDSGGDPEHIPELTFEQFKLFYARFYHPSNAQVFLYGDIPTADHLRFLNPVLSDFTRQPAPIAVPRQSRWPSPRTVTRGYAVGEEENAGDRTFMALNWCVGDALDPVDSTAWDVLSCLLVGDDAAPLKKAIIDSKLGGDIFMSGSGSAAYESSFHVGIKGSEPGSAEAFQSLVMDCLSRLVKTGFPKARVEAAFQQLAYQNLEVQTLFPLHLLEEVNSSWPYAGDPLIFLRMRENLAAGRDAWKRDPGMFGKLIQERLLDNPHRLFVVLKPDVALQVKRDREFSERMAEKRAKMTPGEIAEVAGAAERLEAQQGEPNSPEALAKLPQLNVSDLPANPRHIPTQVGNVAGMTVLRNDVFSNGVNYLDISIDLAGLPQDLLPELPRFCEAFSKMGAAGQSFTDIAERRAACTGGIGAWTSVCRHASAEDRTLRRLRFTMKTLDEQVDPALDLLRDLVFGVDAGDAARLRDVLTQTRAWFRTGLVNDGSGTARRRAARGLRPGAALEYMFNSPEALRNVEGLLERFEEGREQLVNDVSRIRTFMADRRRWTVSFTGSDSAFTSLSTSLECWAGRMRDSKVIDDELPFIPYREPPREGLAGPMTIAHCAMVMPAPGLMAPEVPQLWLGFYLCSFDYFLNEIRLKGNAYGAGAGYDDMMGLAAFNSFRDPRIAETLAVFDGLGEFVRRAAWTQTDLDRGIIGTAKSAERPIRPGDATGTALTRFVRGDTDAMREARYHGLLQATPGSLKRVLLDFLEASRRKAAVCVVSSREKLEEANRALGSRGLDISSILT